jgi:hypothetical protein
MTVAQHTIHTRTQLFYGNSLFSADVVRTMGFGSGIKGLAIANLIIQLMALPGAFWGRLP